MNLECGNCGERNHPPGAVYCLTCGAVLPEERPAADPAARTETMVLDPPMGQPDGSGAEAAPPRFRFAFRPLAVVGALALGVSGALAWIDGRGADFSGWDLRLENLAGDPATADWLNLGLIVALVGGASLVFAFVDLWYSPFRWMGLAAVGFVAWFAEWIGLYSSDAEDVIRDIGIGPFVAVGGIVLLAMPQWTAVRGGETRQPRQRGPGIAAILVPFIILGAAVSWAFVSGEDPRGL